MTVEFRIELLSSIHDRERFYCGVEPLDRYLRELAAQDVKRRISNCFVALDDVGAIAGYYTFAAASLPLTELPPAIVRKLPRYGVVPAGLIGRLAVDVKFRRRGLAGAMVMDAVVRAARADPAIFAIVVEAKDESAEAFYRSLGFLAFAVRSSSYFLPISTALQALAKAKR
ncbi:GNAT family N-acetyltransferase [Methylosinus sp. RM1]|uniref:GNAT family N-acetyltransferase n=1 Tax=Methylosinus sp. RM1 TaxID=2583817 RepID=UPI001407532F